MLDSKKVFSFETEVTKQGGYIHQPHDHPEALPIYMTTAFNVEDLAGLEARYKTKGFCYNRNRNPNRAALIELMTYLEHGENSIACSSGMGAISTVVISLIDAGDHILSDRTLYGETIEIFTDILGKYGIETTFADFTDLADIKANIRPNTKLLYTETVSNPTCYVPDLKAIADIAHKNGSYLVVDNTFMTAALCRPLDLGADVVVNSLTKFASGHSDVVCGAATGRADLIQKAYNLQLLLGTQADPFSSWLAERGIRTLELRVKKQAENAAALAKFLDASPYVLKVNHCSLPNHPQHKLATEQFGNYYGGMLSIDLPDDREKMNLFMRSLNLCHYAMTLGGYRTTMAYPVLSSHDCVPEAERLKMGITNGLLRFSCGIENTEDLVADFAQALEIAYGK